MIRAFSCQVWWKSVMGKSPKRCVIYTGQEWVLIAAIAEATGTIFYRKILQGYSYHTRPVICLPSFAQIDPTAEEYTRKCLLRPLITLRYTISALNVRVFWGNLSSVHVSWSVLSLHAHTKQIIAAVSVLEDSASKWVHVCSNWSHATSCSLRKTRCKVDRGISSPLLTRCIPWVYDMKVCTLYALNLN